jgi:diguanylate cyclase (GGDEF)-like protein
MRLTTSSLGGSGHVRSKWWLPPAGAVAAISVALLAVFELDRTTGTAPLEHLYYLPILFAALRFGKRGGIAAAAAAVLLYHVANHPVVKHPYRGVDVVQIVLFLAVGILTAQLTTDAARFRLLALTDDLTGLHNLRSFEARLGRMLRASREKNAPLAVLVLDLDRLKTLNDHHGHLAGAEAVRTVGKILAAQLPPDAVACRYGGDEFAIALPGCSAPLAKRIASRLCQVVNTTAPLLAGHALPEGTLSISIGVACSGSPSDAPTANDEAGEALFRAADKALYLAKAAGRNCTRVAEVAAAVRSRLALLETV